MCDVATFKYHPDMPNVIHGAQVGLSTGSNFYFYYNGVLSGASFLNLNFDDGSDEPAQVKKKEAEKVYDNYIRAASPLIVDNLFLNVSSNTDKKATIEIIDIAGRCVKSQKLNIKRGQRIMNFGKFNTGIYFLKIISIENEKPEVHKITVIR